MSANDRQEGGEHYKRLKPEPWDVAAAWELDFFLGNAQKYIARASQKEGEAALLDLKKAAHYLEKKIELLAISERDYQQGRELRSVSLSSLLLPEFFSNKEGGEWLDWYIGSFHRRQLAMRSKTTVDFTSENGEICRVHALKFSDGRIWDCVNGWRDHGKAV